MSTLFTDVYLYDADRPSGMVGPADLLIVANRIAAIGPRAREREVIGTGGSSQPDRTIEGGSSLLILPGLINAHFHSPANHLKGSLPSLPLELFMLYESPADEPLKPTPREAYVRTMLGATEMIRTGTTAVQDDAFLMPVPTPEIVDAVMQAYADSGIRASVALDQPELPERDKLPRTRTADPDFRRFLEAPPPMDAAGLLDMYDHLISRWHGAEGGRLTAAVSVSAPQRVSPDYFHALDDLSRRWDIPLFAHMLETKLQRTLTTTQPRFASRSLVEYTADLGLLNERTNVIHAVWVSDHDLELIGSAGAVIAHNPVSNLRLGSGVAPFRRFRDFGIKTALGVDEAICDDSCNMWGVVKMAGLVHNVAGLDSDLWPAAREVLDCLWSGGAAALRQSHLLGAIREGYLADLVAVDLHSRAFTPFNDLRGQLVYCEAGDSVRLTMVDGRVVFEDGAVSTVDEHQLLAEARDIFAEKLPFLERARNEAARLFPHYQALVREAAAADVDMNRWVTGT
jgi:5-methylthioadenosine/S-adenosylhomocysteine deaminase